MPTTQAEVLIKSGQQLVGRYQVGLGAHLIGRDPGCVIRVDMAQVAPRHARLTVNPFKLLIEDLNSETGTYVDEQRVVGVVVLQPKQKIRIGSTVLEINPLSEADLIVTATSPADAVPAVQDGPTVTAAAPKPSLPLPESELRKVLPAASPRGDNYVPGKAVARGGMGAVLLAKDVNIRRAVAMKVVLPEKQTSQGSILRFIEEAQVTGQLEHPNIVPIHELGVDERGQVFYTMKFVKGVTLKEVLQQIKDGNSETIARYPLAHLLTIFQKVCDAVAFAHSKGVVHRDLKPENIMIGEFGEVQVMDWGLAKILCAEKIRQAEGPAEATGGAVVESARVSDSDVYKTLDGTILGTPQFMALEQAEGEVQLIDGRTDVYALGAILYNILTLHPPFEGDDARSVLEKVRTGKIVPPTDYNRSAQRSSTPLLHLPNARVPEALSAVAMKALEKAMVNRYQTVKELQADIEAYQTGFATSAEQAGALKLLWLLIKRHKVEFGLSAAALAVIIALTVGYLVRITASERLAVANEKRALDTLHELRETAPTFRAQAEALLNEGKFDQALTKIGYAINLVDDNPDYRLFRANLLESSQHLADAAAEYGRVLALRPADIAAKQSLALCESLLADNGGAATLRREIQARLVDALLAQDRRIEAAPLALLLGKGQAIAEAAIRARLTEYASQRGWNPRQLRQLPNGMFALDLRHLALGDLNLLQGLPIVHLNLDSSGISDLSSLTNLPLTDLHLNDTKVSDLSPLRGMKLSRLLIDRCPVIGDLTPLKGMPLTILHCSENRVVDLSPLQGMPLGELTVSRTRVTDLTPLQGMPLTTLVCDHTQISDLTPLRGMPLTELQCHSTQVSDLTPLEGMRLEALALTPGRITKGLEIVRGMKSLQRISDSPWPKGWMAPDEFWKEYDARQEAERKRTPTTGEQQ